MAKQNPQPAPKESAKPSGKSAGIPLPAAGFKPSTGRSGISAQLRDFYTRAWEQYQKDNPTACIRDESLVRALRLEWYGYLVEQGFNKLTCSQVAGQWHVSDAVYKNVAYIRDEEVLSKIKK